MIYSMFVNFSTDENVKNINIGELNLEVTAIISLHESYVTTDWIYFVIKGKLLHFQDQNLAPPCRPLFF